VTRTPVGQLGQPISVKFYIGIDPGLSGVLAVLVEKPGARLEVSTHRVPTMHVAKKSGKGKVHRYNLPMMFGLLKQFTGTRVIAGLEELSGRPGQSSQSVFGMGRGFGIWEALLAAAQIPMVPIPPQTWKKNLGVTGKPGQDDRSRKAESVLKAQQLFPWVEFPYVTDHNKADAVLIAEYVRRTVPL
jgi:hypothetical protein